MDELMDQVYEFILDKLKVSNNDNIDLIRDTLSLISQLCIKQIMNYLIVSCQSSAWTEACCFI